MPKVFVLTNHVTTEEQVADLKENWHIREVCELPADLKKIWGTVPPQAESIGDYIQPVLTWLQSECKASDVVWVQGEWGATVTVLLWCKQNGIQAIYSTTGRMATETRTENGVVLTHVFKHVRFRKYPVG